MNFIRTITAGPLRVHVALHVSVFWIRKLSYDNVEYRRRQAYPDISWEIGWTKAVRDLSEMNIKQSRQWANEHFNELDRARLKMEG